MASSRTIQFAVVREDPLIEVEMVRRVRARKALLIASGGCTALTLAAAEPGLEITLLDPNPSQLALIRRKLEALALPAGAERDRAFNVGETGEGAGGDASGLNACGNFEALFRQLRGFLYEFVAPRTAFARLFSRDAVRPEELAAILASKYWPVAFELFFSDSVLNAMFGPDATQHAPKGSYPAYFRRALERGLASPAGSGNYFLHHILLGHYVDRPDCLPAYLAVSPGPGPSPATPFRWIEGTLDQVTDLAEYDLIGLSNIFDWMPRPEIERLAARLRAGTKPGSALIYRQLNHSTDLQGLFGEDYTFDGALESRLLGADRSLFYSKLNLGIRRTEARA